MATMVETEIGHSTPCDGWERLADLLAGSSPHSGLEKETVADHSQGVPLSRRCAARGPLGHQLRLAKGGGATEALPQFVTGSTDWISISSTFGSNRAQRPSLLIRPRLAGSCSS